MTAILPDAGQLRSDASRLDAVADRWQLQLDELARLERDTTGWGAVSDSVAGAVRGVRLNAEAAAGAHREVAARLRALATYVDSVRSEYLQVGARISSPLYGLTTPTSGLATIGPTADQARLSQIESGLRWRMNDAAAAIRAQAERATLADAEDGPNWIPYGLRVVGSDALLGLGDWILGVAALMALVGNLGSVPGMIGDTIDSAGRDPLGTAGDLVDVDTLTNHPVRWLTALLPDLVLGRLSRVGRLTTTELADGGFVVRRGDDVRPALLGTNGLPISAKTTVEGITYLTDTSGRVTSVSGSLSLVEGPPLNPAVAKAVRALGQPGDDAGHLIGRILGGTNHPLNLAPQDMNFNRGVYRKMEDDLRSAHATHPGGVNVSITIEYGPVDFRPRGYTVTSNVFDEPRHYVNAPGGGIDPIGGL